MLKTYGAMPATKPEGMGARVRIPVMLRMDTDTGDGRLLDSEGGDVKMLPFGIWGQFADTYGHEGAVPTGTCYTVTLDTDTGLGSGEGYLLDDKNGQYHAYLIATKAMAGNSVDLRDVEARLEENISESGEWDYRIRFTKWVVGKTTGVGMPAFFDAHLEIVAALKDPEHELNEIMAAAYSGEQPLVWECEPTYNIVMPEVITDVPAELLASGIVQQHELFFHPEADVPTKIVVDAQGHVYGHLGLWDSFHDGIEGAQIRIPRPTDGYASFNKPGVLTNRGIVSTGPIFAYGGHRPGKGVVSLEEAYGGVENTWADVRISEGVLGPWISGVVRPGVSDETVYAARASRISGHWLGGRLKAIVSVNAEGFEVPGQGDIEIAPELAAGFAFSVHDGELELVASFPGVGASSAGTGTSETADPPAPEVTDDAAVAAASSDDLLLALLLEDDDDDVD